jgi:formylglycine-generating enzyme required for sulfatase activity
MANRVPLVWRGVLACAVGLSAVAAQGAERKPGDSFRDCPHCPEMVVVPAGSFIMGSPPEETAREPVPARDAAWERPQHPVTIAHAFAIGKYVVTFAQWDACVDAGGCTGDRPVESFKPKDDAPLAAVSWNDAQAYIAWLNSQIPSAGSPYALPSEAEWEYAARAGTKTARWWGDDNGGGEHPRAEERNFGTIAVGSYPPNPFGLYDMLGGVWQWTADCWVDSYAAAPRDGSVRSDGTCAERVIRGGSTFGDWRSTWRSAARSWRLVSIRTERVGFRVVRRLP